MRVVIDDHHNRIRTILSLLGKMVIIFPLTFYSMTVRMLAKMVIIFPLKFYLIIMPYMLAKN